MEGLDHRQVIELLLSRQPVLKLTTVELSQTSIKRGRRKRGNSKKVGRRQYSLRSYKRTPNNASPSGVDNNDRSRKSSLIRRFSAKRSKSPFRRGNPVRRTASNIERGSSSRRLPMQAIAASSSSSSPSSSPGSQRPGIVLVEIVHYGSPPLLASSRRISGMFSCKQALGRDIRASETTTMLNWVSDVESLTLTLSKLACGEVYLLTKS